MRVITFREAIIEALREEMRQDERVFILGEDVGIYGGAYGATRGLWEEFGEERVRDTAISEQAIIGAAIGAAMTGMRPVAEIMYVDFMTLAMDQFCNQAAKIRYMFGGKAKIPLVVRTQGGAGRCIAAHHSQSLEAWFLHVPGIYVVMPSTPYDAKGLLKSAIRNDNPILFIEHKSMYNNKGEVPVEEYTIPLGVAEVKKEGKDLTIVAHSRSAVYALQAAEELEKEGISAEVVDPRTLHPLDIETILTSVKKTNRVMIVEEGCKTGGVGAEFGMQIVEEGFDYLDVPVKRVAAADVPVPMSEPLEKAAIPDKTDIIKAAKELVGL
jgi:pyruvate/2-oxoglutarate/acetoin dehydrogenase E1 component